MNKWWAYLHTNGSILVKRFLGKEDLEDAKESSFVERFVGPFDAINNADAENKAKIMLHVESKKTVKELLKEWNLDERSKKDEWTPEVSNAYNWIGNKYRNISGGFFAWQTAVEKQFPNLSKEEISLVMNQLDFSLNH